MAAWGTVLGQLVRWLPELQRLMPVLERITSPEAREEQRKRIQAAAIAAEQARDAAVSTNGALIEVSRRLAAQTAELQARVESCEMRVKDVVADLRAIAETQAKLDANLRSATAWVRAVALLGIAIVVLLVIILVKK
jgi:hypothetical protein